MSVLRVGSLFSGIGGIELGLERAGMKVVWQVENDPYAQKVLTKHWPNVRRYSDVRDVHVAPPREYACDNCVERVDLICGGFPCQDISVAGKGAGIIRGARSGLWKEFRRIIDEVRPSWVVIENVPALRSRGLGVVLSDLSALGYDAEWDCYPAAAFGAPTRRERMFIVAYPPSAGVERRLQGRAPSSGGPWGWCGEEDLRALGSEPFRRGRWPEPLLCGVGTRLPNRVDRLRCLGNAVVPQVSEYIGRLIVAAHGAGK
jgi:DNA (cytosine-5)-methyltransferase 1